MAEHNCLFFLPQRSSKLSTSTTTVQNECELKSAPICSPRRQFGAKLCEYVPFTRCSHCGFEALWLERATRMGHIYFTFTMSVGALSSTMTRQVWSRLCEKWAVTSDRACLRCCGTANIFMEDLERIRACLRCCGTANIFMEDLERIRACLRCSGTANIFMEDLERDGKQKTAQQVLVRIPSFAPLLRFPPCNSR